MKRLLKFFVAFALSLSVLAGASIGPAPSHNVASAKSYSVSVVSSQLTVKHGNAAAVTIKGKPKSRGYITVYYSKRSKAKGLSSKVSNRSGYITWAWIVGSKTHKGSYHVYVKLGNKKKTTTLHVK